VVVLRVVEGPCRCDLGRDRPVVGSVERLLVGTDGIRGGGQLGVGRRVDGRAVLGAAVVPLAHALGRVVVLEEHGQQLLVGDLLRVIDHEDRLGVPGLAEQTSL